MRVLLIGPPRHRAELRAALAGTDIDIAGEAATLAEARASGVDADGWLTAPDDGPADPDPDAADYTEPLTKREQDVLELVAEGLSNKSIAARLGISDQTVKFHVASICGKLGVANRTEAVRRALRRGLITI
jgi:two-component system nitrate/nitrite response regulator NarL